MENVCPYVCMYDFNKDFKSECDYLKLWFILWCQNEKKIHCILQKQTLHLFLISIWVYDNVVCVNWTVLAYEGLTHALSGSILFSLS